MPNSASSPFSLGYGSTTQEAREFTRVRDKILVVTDNFDRIHAAVEKQMPSAKWAIVGILSMCVWPSTYIRAMNQPKRSPWRSILFFVITVIQSRVIGVFHLLEATVSRFHMT